MGQRGERILVARTNLKADVQEPAVVARRRILDTAYELFTRKGVKSVGVDAIVARSGVAKMTLYRHFPSKEDLALAFLELREERWTVEWLKAAISQRSTDPAEKLLLIFDLYHEWFQKPDFEGCSFIKVMLEAQPGSPLHKAAAQYLINIGIYITDLAKAAGVADPMGFSKAWHMLMEGSIISASAGNRNAALEAKRAATVLLKAWPSRSV